MNGRPSVVLGWGFFSRKDANIAKVRPSVVGMKIALSPFELKSVEKVINAPKKQELTYLKLTGMRLGYLLNFGEAMMERGITRTVNGLCE